MGHECPFWATVPSEPTPDGVCRRGQIASPDRQGFPCEDRAIAGVAAIATAVGLMLSGCGSDTETETTTTKTTTTKAAPTSPKVAPREEDAAGPNPTIASYIKENNIQEAPVNRGDPGSPTIDLPVPDGWEPAGEDTPEWAYGASSTPAPRPADYTPSIVALVSKLAGNVDPQKIIDLAPGELNNLSGLSAWNEGATARWVTTRPSSSAARGSDERPDEGHRPEDCVIPGPRRALRAAAQRRRSGASSPTSSPPQRIHRRPDDHHVLTLDAAAKCTPRFGGVRRSGPA